MPKISKAIRDVLVGNQLGDVYPYEDPIPPPIYDGRTAGLRILKKYYSELVFYRSGGVDDGGDALPPVPFSIAERDIHVEWPDDESDLRLPSIVLLGQAAADIVGVGLTSNLDEGTIDQYGDGTVVATVGEHTEQLLVEVWADTKAQRRAIIAGLEQAMIPLEQMSGLRFRCPDYYDQLVVFSLGSVEVVDDDSSTFARRKARLVMEMRINVVAVVRTKFLEPTAELEVDTKGDDSQEPTELDE